MGYLEHPEGVMCDIKYLGKVLYLLTHSRPLYLKLVRKEMREVIKKNPKSKECNDLRNNDLKFCRANRNVFL